MDESGGGVTGPDGVGIIGGADAPPPPPRPEAGGAPPSDPSDGGAAGGSPVPCAAVGAGMSDRGGSSRLVGFSIVVRPIVRSVGRGH